MVTPQINSHNGQPDAPRVSILGVLFFILGAPHLYGALKRRTSPSGQFTPARYAMVALLAGVLAGMVELAIF